MSLNLNNLIPLVTLIPLALRYSRTRVSLAIMSNKDLEELSSKIQDTPLIQNCKT